jgi:hypothetical protein
MFRRGSSRRRDALTRCRLFLVKERVLFVEERVFPDELQHATEQVKLFPVRASDSIVHATVWEEVATFCLHEERLPPGRERVAPR